MTWLKSSKFWHNGTIMTGIRGKGGIIPRKLISKDGSFSTPVEDHWDKLSDIDLLTLQDFRKYGGIYLKRSYISSKLLINFQIDFSKYHIFADKHHGRRNFFYIFYRTLSKFCFGFYFGVFYKMTKNLRSRIN